MSNIINNSRMFLKRNSSTILTCFGAVGVVATAIVAAKNTIKAVKIVDRELEDNVALSKKDIVKLTAPAYIPTALVGLSTIVCIFGANTLSKKTQTSLMSAYALLDQSYKEYRDRAVELYGDDTDKKIRDGIATIHYNDQSPLETNDGKKQFFDFYGLQFFESTIEDIQVAENELNRLLLKSGYVGLNTLYDMLGIECADIDYDVGWSTNSLRDQGCDKIEFSCEQVKKEDGSEFYTFTMLCEPTVDYLY